jgi:hypothetical protein
VNRPRPSGAAAGGGQTVKAVIVVAVVVLVGFLILKNGIKSPSTTAAGTSATTVKHGHTTTTLSAAATTTTLALISPANVKLQVLNGVGTGTLAGQWTAKLHANPGYNTLTPRDATTVGLSTSAIYIITPGFTREADALATQVGLTPAIVVPTIPAPATAPIPAAARASANLVLVIGRDLAGTA